MTEPEQPSTTAAYGPATEETPRGHEADPSVLIVGESLIDIVEREGREPVELVGGSPANVALGLGRLGHPVELTTWFGTDVRGQRIRTWLETDGVVISPGSEGADHTSTARARIDADGAWTIDLVHLAEAPRWDGEGVYEDRGDSVLIVDGVADGLTPVTLTHDGESNFAIWAWGESYPDLIVNDIGAYDGTTLLPDGTLVLQVDADGTWTISPS